MSAGEYDKHILFPGDSIEVEFTLPDLVGQTEILTEEHRLEVDFIWWTDINSPDAVIAHFEPHVKIIIYELASL